MPTLKKMPVLFFIQLDWLLFREVQELLLRNCLRRGGFGWFPSLSSYQGRDLFVPRSLGRSPTTLERHPKKGHKELPISHFTNRFACVWFIFVYFVSIWLMCALTFKKTWKSPRIWKLKGCFSYKIHCWGFWRIHILPPWQHPPPTA